MRCLEELQLKYKNSFQNPGMLIGNILMTRSNERFDLIDLSVELRDGNIYHPLGASTEELDIDLKCIHDIQSVKIFPMRHLKTTLFGNNVVPNKHLRLKSLFSFLSQFSGVELFTFQLILVHPVNSYGFHDESLTLLNFLTEQKFLILLVKSMFLNCDDQCDQKRNTCFLKPQGTVCLILILDHEVIFNLLIRCNGPMDAVLVVRSHFNKPLMLPFTLRKVLVAFLVKLIRYQIESLRLMRNLVSFESG